MFSGKMQQKILQFRLIGAIERKEIAELKSLNTLGVRINASIMYGKTPLLYSLELGLPDIAMMLLKAGANPTLHERVSWQRFPLHLAALNDLIEPTEALLAGGLNCDCVDSGQMTPLHYAAYKGHMQIVQLLLSHGAYIDAKDNVGRTPLNRAVAQRRNDVFCLLLGAGADINNQDKYGWTSFCHAVMWNDPSLVELLLRNGASVTVTNSRGETPLHTACARIRYVHGVVVNATSFDIVRRARRIPTEEFKHAVQTQQKTKLKIIRDLIDANADIEVENIMGERPLHITDDVTFLVYVVLAGSWINKDILMFEGVLSTAVDFADPRAIIQGWLLEQYSNQLHLKRQCRRTVRRNIRSGQEPVSVALGRLPLPKQLQSYLNLCDFGPELSKLGLQMDDSACDSVTNL